MCLGIPAKVINAGEAGSALPMGEIDIAGERRPCCFAYVPEAEAGDWVLIQNSFAMEVLDEEAAKQSLEAIEEFNLIEDPTGQSAGASIARNEEYR